MKIRLERGPRVARRFVAYVSDFGIGRGWVYVYVAVKGLFGLSIER